MFKKNKNPKTDFGDAPEDAFTPGDTPIDEIDWDKVAYLQEQEDAIAGLKTQAQQNFAAVVLLAEMYGNDLVVK